MLLTEFFFCFTVTTQDDALLNTQGLQPGSSQPLRYLVANYPTFLSSISEIRDAL